MNQSRKSLALVLALGVLLLTAAGLLMWKQQGKQGASAETEVSAKSAGRYSPSEAEERFWKQLEAQKPVYIVNERKCFVEGATVRVVSGDPRQDNAFGGVTTDLMKLALSPPTQRPGPPNFQLQNYDQLLSTCPTCGATYFEIDFTNINSGRPANAIERLKKFNLVELAPELVDRPKADWTYDEKAFARYLTQQVAGFPDYELGYTALSGAYNSNVAIGLGREYRIPGAAFYALAAAQFKHHIDSGNYENKQSASLVAMAQGELYRLLARRSDARAAFARAREIGGLDAQTAQVMAKLSELNEDRDFSLQLAPLDNVQEPPIGWYVHRLLPGINGELEYERGNWAALDAPDAILQRIRERLAK